jgi:hypothetical protein
MAKSYPSKYVETSIPPRPSRNISLCGPRGFLIQCEHILLLANGRLVFCFRCVDSVAVFDVVQSPRRPSPFVLLQPHLRLQDIFPSPSAQSDYPTDETAFVGLVPGNGSLYALSPDHFPLVAFSDQAPTQRVEDNEGVVVSTENGMLQCFEGTTDRRCLTGVRALKADSLSRLARLLDGVPGPATPPPPAAVGGPPRSENANSEAYPGSEPLVFGEGETPVVPWELLANLPESLTQGQNPWVPSPSTLLLALVSVVASLLWFKRKVPTNGHGATMPDELVRKMAVARKAASITPLELVNGATHAPDPESHDVENGSSAKATLPEDSLTPMELPPTTRRPSTTALATGPGTSLPSSTTNGSAKASPVKAESPEGAEDVGEVKKKHRKRRRRRKGDTKDPSAEGEEPENDDGEGGEGGEDGNAVPPSTPSLVPPPTPAPSASLSLVVSDTVLGTFLSCCVPKTRANPNQVTVHMALLSMWAPCRAVQWPSNVSSGTLLPSRTVKSAFSRMQTTTQTSFGIITKRRTQASSTSLLSCALPRLRTSLSGPTSSARSLSPSIPNAPCARSRLASGTCTRSKSCTATSNRKTSSSRVRRRANRAGTGC